MARLLKILVVPSLLTLAIVASAVMGITSYLSERSLENTYVVKDLQQAGPCFLCHDGSFDRASLRIAYLPCEARPAN